MRKELPDGSNTVLPVARTLTFFQPGPGLQPDELAAAARLALTPLQYQQLSSEQRLVITANVDTTRRLMQETSATFLNIQALSADELDELLQNINALDHLVNRAHIPLESLLACPAASRLALLKNPCAVAELVQKEGVTLSRLSSLSTAELQIVLSDPGSEEAQEILQVPSKWCCFVS